MSFAARVRALEDAEDARWWAEKNGATHPFEECDNQFCDRQECRHEYAPGQVCGRARDDARHTGGK